ncbi:unnamed protein product [Chrysoparadoxa australica]
MSELQLRKLRFRVTGDAAVRRLRPILESPVWAENYGVTWEMVDTAESRVQQPLDFVYETTVSREWSEFHSAAGVRNKLSGSSVLEDKARMALLQRESMSLPGLATEVMKDVSAVGAWAQERWGDVRELNVEEDDGKCLVRGMVLSASTISLSPIFIFLMIYCVDWWCVKASKGNGGADVWVIHRGNAGTVVKSLRAGEEYVVQRYVARPLLWNDRKFHFRAYAVLGAAMKAWLYTGAYILSASKAYHLSAASPDLADDLVHITNLAVNKHTPGHPGQVPCCVQTEYPQLWGGMLALWGSVVEGAAPFMREQSSPHHFEFFGLDIIADQSGRVWLIEANRMPGLQSSKQNKEKEDVFYNDMILRLVCLVTRHLLFEDEGEINSDEGEPPASAAIGGTGLRFSEVPVGSAGSEANTSSKELWKNVLRFAAYSKKLSSGQVTKSD